MARPAAVNGGPGDRMIALALDGAVGTTSFAIHADRVHLLSHDRLNAGVAEAVRGRARHRVTAAARSPGNNDFT